MGAVMPSIKDVVGTNGSGPKTFPVEADLTQRYPLGNETIGAAMSVFGCAIPRRSPACWNEAASSPSGDPP